MHAESNMFFCSVDWWFQSLKFDSMFNNWDNDVSYFNENQSVPQSEAIQKNDKILIICY